MQVMEHDHHVHRLRYTLHQKRPSTRLKDFTRFKRAKGRSVQFTKQIKKRDSTPPIHPARLPSLKQE
jgi:hypothetical protein